jgi:hypothetical protein
MNKNCFGGFWAVWGPCQMLLPSLFPYIGEADSYTLGEGRGSKVWLHLYPYLYLYYCEWPLGGTLDKDKTN